MVAAVILTERHCFAARLVAAIDVFFVIFADFFTRWKYIVVSCKFCLTFHEKKRTAWTRNGQRGSTDSDSQSTDGSVQTDMHRLLFVASQSDSTSLVCCGGPGDHGATSGRQPHLATHSVHAYRYRIGQPCIQTSCSALFNSTPNLCVNSIINSRLQTREFVLYTSVD